MTHQKYNILILAELNERASSTLKNGINLAKIVDGNVHFFSVTKPTEVVEKECQLSAIRTINQKYNKTSKEIKKFITPIADHYKTTINYSHAFGNVKNEITDYISKNKPDIIVLGKRKSKLLSLLGDNISDFILNVFDGTIMISSDTNTIDYTKKIALGILNKATSNNNNFRNHLISLSKNPTKVFRIFEDATSEQKENASSLEKTVEYVFEKGDNTIKNIANYCTKSNTNLLLLETSNTHKNYNLKEVINTIDCSLILTN